MITLLSEGIVNKSDGPKHPTHVAGPGDKDWAQIAGLGVIWHASSEETRQSETRADRWTMFTRRGMRYEVLVPKYTNKFKINSSSVSAFMHHDHEFESHLKLIY